jgi:hypothetical protein
MNFFSKELEFFTSKKLRIIATEMNLFCRCVQKFAPEKKGWLMDESAEAFLNLFPQRLLYLIIQHRILTDLEQRK